MLSSAIFKVDWSLTWKKKETNSDFNDQESLS